MNKQNITLCIILSLLSLLASCRKHREGPLPTNYYYYDGSTNNPHYYTYTDTNRFILPYADRAINGYSKFYYAGTGILISEGNYENGTPSGYWKLYYPDGKIMREGNYSNGQLSGYWKFYYVDGKMKEEGNYTNSIRTGTWKYYHPTGYLSATGNYSNGATHGEWKYYDANGILISVIIYA